MQRGALIALLHIMRMTPLVLWFFVAACTSSSSSSDPSTIPDRIDAVSCSVSIDEACGSGSCDRTLEAAKHDPQLCSPGFPAVLRDCGNFQVVTKSEIDTVKSYYYHEGQLVAIVLHVVGSHFATCIAGPQSFEAPQCSREPGVLLPACRATH